MAVLVFTLIAHYGNFLVCERGSCIDDGDLCLGVGVDCNIVTLDRYAAEFNTAVDTEADLF